jgi:hypothetical protein
MNTSRAILETAWTHDYRNYTHETRVEFVYFDVRQARFAFSPQQIKGRETSIVKRCEGEIKTLQIFHIVQKKYGYAKIALGAVNRKLIDRSTYFDLVKSYPERFF